MIIIVKLGEIPRHFMPILRLRNRAPWSAGFVNWPEYFDKGLFLRGDHGRSQILPNRCFY